MVVPLVVAVALTVSAVVVRARSSMTVLLANREEAEEILGGLQDEVDGAVEEAVDQITENVLEGLGLLPTVPPSVAPASAAPTRFDENSIVRTVKRAVEAALETSEAKIEAQIVDAIESRLTLELDVANEYEKTPAARYRWARDETRVVEPHRKSTLLVKNPKKKAAYHFNVSGRMYCCGPNVTLTFTEPDAQTTISAIEEDEGHAGTLDVIVKYVRREIRTLSPSDRDAFFDAVGVTYHTPTRIGAKLYGPRYRSAREFAEFHNAMSGQRDCDHLHGGMGFLTQHAAFTRAYEQALQAVNPVVAMPFWDYSIDQQAASTSTAGAVLENFYASPVFGDDFYGPVKGDSVVVSRGRFAYARIPSALVPDFASSWNLTAVSNAYGLLRSPWNQNSIPFVSRHNTSFGFALSGCLLPGCAQMYQQMTMPYWKQFAPTVEDSPHGSLHIAVGGTWNADYEDFLVSRHNYSYSKAQDFATIAIVRIWRLGYVDCPSACASDVPETECKCTCPHLEMWLKQNKTAQVLSRMMPNLATAPKFGINEDGVDISTTLLRLVCNDYDAVHPAIGDFFESSSPMDALFWPTHPTLDRLWHWRATQGWADETWGDDVSTCWGHREHDVTLWRASQFQDDDDDDDGDRLLTNADLYQLFDASTHNVPYVYDDFEWPHCAEAGYPHDLLFDPDAAVSSSGNAVLDDDSPLAAASDAADSNTRNIQNAGNQ
ncbi:hypothetical protein CTAYLR_000128 [Chrysophaeum taylorii]|uniref:Tyrosinase copper-binding domain-containing protein n=1 Tax=Chrysophaeum taylorii TaxID=2483200 RepID=A0AAD7UHA8_9STRA|nr:hypothetical protein CTAYLR_000128 [Chrysophaeum taylorii]